MSNNLPRSQPKILREIDRCATSVAQRTQEKRSSDAADALMKYKITISEQARRELRQLPKELRRNIGYRNRSHE